MAQETLQDVRKKAGLTQQEIADELGCSRATYSAIEADPSRATILQAQTICRLLSRSYEHIFFGRDAS